MCAGEETRFRLIRDVSQARMRPAPSRAVSRRGAACPEIGVGMRISGKMSAVGRNAGHVDQKERGNV